MKKVSKYLGLLLTLSFMLMLSSGKHVSAEVCNVEKVDDIDNAVCPKAINISGINKHSVVPVQFTLTESGIVKVYIQIGREYIEQGEVYLSTDYDGKYRISDVSTITESTYLKYCLDPGKYYLQLSWSYQIYNVGVGVVYEASNTEELHTVSTFTKANILGVNKLDKGFLSLSTPKDYYEFTVDKECMAEIQYSFDTSFAKNNDEGQLMIYDSNQILIGNASYSKGDLGSKTERIKLEPGKYFITMSGMNGRTTLKVVPNYISTKLVPSTKKWTEKDVSVKVDTTIDFEAIDVIKYDVTEADLDTEELWNPVGNDKKYVETNGSTFVATSNGTYSVRIKDKLGKFTLKKIKISNIDKKAPKITGVKADTYYNKPVTISLEDKESGILKATLNGKDYKSGSKISEKGKYTLKVYDNVGNKTTLKFELGSTDFKVTLTPLVKNWTKKNVPVKVNTNIDFTSLEVIKYDVTKADLTSDQLWKPAAGDKKYVETNGTTFEVTSNGVYSVRITDKLGKTTLAKIKISNIDKKQPKVSGVQDGKKYKKQVTINWTDQGSGVVKATLNNKKCVNGQKITKDGTYVLRLYDKVGNKTVIEFVVDRTKPVIAGVENGKSYTFATVSISDELSGLKKFTVNGIEYDMSKNPLTLAANGTYEVKAYDNAGNVSSKKFKINMD